MAVIKRVIFGDTFDAVVRRRALDGIAPVAMVLDPSSECVNEEVKALFPTQHVLEIPHKRKPEQLYPMIRDFILDKTELGDIVLDPFAGKGTTKQVCEDYGRGYVLIENNRTLAGALVCG